VGDYDNDDSMICHHRASRAALPQTTATHLHRCTQEAGSPAPELSTSATWVVNTRRRLDLVVATMCNDAGDHLYCTLDGKKQILLHPNPTNTAPGSAQSRTAREDLRKKAGLGEPTSKTRAIAVLDYDNDGCPICFFPTHAAQQTVSNNATAPFPKKDQSRIAFSETASRARMGVMPLTTITPPSQLMITNLSNQMLSLITTRVKGLFVDKRRNPRSDAPHFSPSSSAAFFSTTPDAARHFRRQRHIDPEIQKVQANVQIRMPPHLPQFRKGKFQESNRYDGRRLYHASRRRAAYATA